MYKNIISQSKFLLLTIILLSPSFVFGANISVTPMIVDYETEARDILVKDITIKNFDSNPIRVYASVHEIEVDGNNEIRSFVPSSMSDRTKSITSWIEISRARLDIGSNSEVVLPLTLRINPNAAPGEYHAFVGFGSGKNYDEAEKMTLEGKSTGVLVRVSIDKKQTELLRLVTFKTEPFVLNNKEHSFSYTLENAGDMPLTPSGEVIIYDSRGVEINSVTLNNDKTVIAPGEKVDFQSPIPFTNRFGKNKAYLTIEYGENQRAVVYDTNYYFSIPWMYSIIVLSLLVLVPIILTILFRRMSRPNYSNTVNHEASEVPLFVKNSHDHKIHDHDINLRKKD